MYAIKKVEESLCKKIIKLNGGLGNQMFQYAFAYCLAKSFGLRVTLDLSWFEDVKTHTNVTVRPFEIDAFNIDYDAATYQDLAEVVPEDNRSSIQKKLWEIFKIKKYKPKGNKFVQTKSFKFQKEPFEYPDYFYYEGYFQNEKYFKDCREDILKIFSLKEQPDEKNQSVLELVNSTNSVSLHVRRGDYVTLECASKVHGTCSLEYYQKAIEYMAKRVKNTHFFLFSDDIDWVVKNLKIDYPYTVISFNKDKGVFDMELMKNCKHNIIANSSFSWWGAWLNNNPEKIVVAPKRWTIKKQKGSLVPNQWVKL